MNALIRIFICFQWHLFLLMLLLIYSSTGTIAQNSTDNSLRVATQLNRYRTQVTILTHRTDSLEQVVTRLQNRPSIETDPNQEAVNVELASLRRKIRRLSGSIRTLRDENASLTQETKTLNASLQLEKQRVEAMRADLVLKEQELAAAAAELRVLQDVLICMDNFQATRRAKRVAARNDIDRTIELLAFRGRDIAISEREKRSRVHEAFGIFLKYGGGGKDSTICGARELSYYDDYLTADENLEFMDLLYRDDYQLLERLQGADLNEKVRRYNTLLLRNLAAAIEKGDYSAYSEAANAAPRVGVAIVGERKGKTGMGSSDLVQGVRSIYQAFQREEYYEALQLYERYRKFFPDVLERGGTNTSDVMKAHFAAGNILAWNLGSVKQLKRFYPEGSWLNETLSAPLVVGRSLLKEEIMENKAVDARWRKKAARSYAKLYLGNQQR